MKRGIVLAALLLASTGARAQTSPPATPLPPARDGVITPGNGTPGSGSRIDPHMPVVHPKMPGRTPVIRPPSRSSGGRTVIDPR